MKRNALTLVEVLVVVAITALLITILIAALARPPMSDMELCAAQQKGNGPAKGNDYVPMGETDTLIYP